jgi:hypothetical protein
MSRWWVPRVLVASLIAAAAGAQAPEPTVVAVMRSDGIVLPFARFDGRAWTAFPGDGAESASRFPQTYELPSTWRVHPVDGAPARRVGAGSSVAFNTEGENWYQTWGQITDYTPRRLPSEDEPRAGRIGVALSGTAMNASVTTFVRRGPRSAEWNGIRRVVTHAFGRAEHDSLIQPSVVANAAGWPRIRAVPDSAERAARPVALRSMFAARPRVGGGRLYYVDAYKVYPAERPDGGCPPAVYYQGWFRQAELDGAPTLMGEVLTLGFGCDSPGAEPSTVVPFGAFTIGGRSFVVLERMYYEGGERDLLEVTRSGLRPALASSR